MQLLKRKAAQRKNIQVTTLEDTTDGVVTRVKIDGGVEVATRDGWLCFWVAGREVQVGPLTAEQAEKLSDDLGYEAVE